MVVWNALLLAAWRWTDDAPVVKAGGGDAASRSPPRAHQVRGHVIRFTYANLDSGIASPPNASFICLLDAPLMKPKIPTSNRRVRISKTANL